VIGAVNAEVVVKLLNGIEVVSIITEESAERLNQSEKNEVCAVIKASGAIAATDDNPN
jgi:molybdopterin-binding protein